MESNQKTRLIELSAAYVVQADDYINKSIKAVHKRKKTFYKTAAATLLQAAKDIIAIVEPEKVPAIEEKEEAMNRQDEKAENQPE